MASKERRDADRRAAAPLAARIREARTAAGISQEEAARRIGVVHRTYTRWERGETLGFIGHIGAIAQALETTTDELMGEARPAPHSASVEDLSTKLDALLEEVQQLREDLADFQNKQSSRRG